MAIGFAAFWAKPTPPLDPPGISFICDNLTLNDRNHTCRSFMCPEESLPAMPRRAVQPVSLSPYVNERFPNWEELLTARDVARLTRRPRWVLLGLSFLRRFPRQHRFRGREIGWLRSDVLRWLAKDLRSIHREARCGARLRRGSARQEVLPLVWPAAVYTVRRRPRHCMRHGGRRFPQ